MCLLPVLAGQGGAPNLQDLAAKAFREGRLVDAEQVLRSLLAQHPRDPAALGFMAVVLDRQAKYKEADRYYQEALALTPGSVPLLNNMGNHYAVAGDQERARQQFLRVVALDPAHHNANLQLARIAVDRKQGQEALGYLSRLQTQEPGIALLSAEALHWAGRSQEASAALDSLQEAAGADPSTLFAMGLALARMGLYGRAEEAFAQVLQRNPGDADALYNLGLAAAHAGHLDRAQGALESALEKRPKDAAILFNLGRVYATRAEYSRAVALLVEARKRSPKDAQILVALARALDGGGYFSDAVVAYDEYLALRPDDEAVRLDRALDYAVTGKPDEAVAEIKRYMARFPKDPDGYFRLALVTERGEPEGAVELLNRALALQPGFASARYERGILLHRLGRSEAALKDFEAAAKVEPYHAGILSELGLVYMALGRPKDAEPVLRRAVEWAPEDRGTLMHLGRALAENGKEEESQAVLARLDSLGPEKRVPAGAASVLGILSLPPAQRLAGLIASLERTVQRKPDDAAARLQLGRALLEAGRKEDATAVLSGAGQVDVATRIELARALRRSSGPEAALRELARIPRSACDDAFFLLQAELLDAAGKASEARQTLNRILPSVIRAPELSLGAAVLEIKWGNYRKGLELAGGAVSIPASLLVRAVALDGMGQTSESGVLLRQAESRWPEWSKAYLIHGALLASRREFQQARRLLASAQALGEEVAGLLKCIEGGADCAGLARGVFLAALTPAALAPEERPAR